MVNLIAYIFTFIVGLIVGSFLNVVSDRLKSEKGFLFGRSCCEFCKKILSPKDLVPLLSFCFLKGKCRFCNKKLSIYYPISEILTGFAFVGVLYYSGILRGYTQFFTWVNFIFLLFIVCAYIIIFLSDAKYKIVPNKVVIPSIVFASLLLIGLRIISLVLYYYQLKNDSFGVYLLKTGFWHNQFRASLVDIGIVILSSFAISLFFWALILLTKGRGMGYGDLKLGFLIGLVNGFPKNVLGIFLGFIFGAGISLILILLKKKTMKDVIPFGPYLILGSVIAFVWGDIILNWYLGLT